MEAVSVSRHYLLHDINDIHFGGHTKCSEANMISVHAAYNVCSNIRQSSTLLIHYLSIYLSIYGATAICLTLADFSEF
jgi:hypothetical protein